MFVGFRADEKRLSRMLDRMAGRVNGTRYALTRSTLPIAGSDLRSKACLACDHPIVILFRSPGLFFLRTGSL